MNRFVAVASALATLVSGYVEANDGNRLVFRPLKPVQPLPDDLRCRINDSGQSPLLVTTHAVFENDSVGQPIPQPAQLQIWCQNNSDEWIRVTVEDKDSNVFHKAVFMEDGRIITIGAMGAHLKEWVRKGDSWLGSSLWQGSWGGRFDRLRDLEMGDVDHDGREEWVMATHDQGVIVVYHPDEGRGTVVELDPRPDTFVHEIEIGDADGDGYQEFYATLSERNQVGRSQSGAIVMYQFDGTQYVRSVVEAEEGTHAKEILVTDLDGDGISEVMGVFAAELNESGGIETPVQIRGYAIQPDGSFYASVLAELEDQHCRFLVAADMDGDGAVEMVATSKRAGVWLLEEEAGGTWRTTNIDRNSGGFEHVANVADLDGDGQVELYIAADKQGFLSRYTWSPKTQSFEKETLGELPNGFTWSIDFGNL